MAQVRGWPNGDEPGVADRQERRHQNLPRHGLAAGQIEGQVAPVENPITATGLPAAASSSKADSAVAAQSLHFDEGMVGPRASWPGSTGAATTNPAFSTAVISGLSP